MVSGRLQWGSGERAACRHPLPPILCRFLFHTRQSGFKLADLINLSKNELYLYHWLVRLHPGKARLASSPAAKRHRPAKAYACRTGRRRRRPCSVSVVELSRWPAGALPCSECKRQQPQARCPAGALRATLPPPPFPQPAARPARSWGHHIVLPLFCSATLCAPLRAAAWRPPAAALEALSTSARRLARLMYTLHLGYHDLVTG